MTSNDNSVNIKSEKRSYHHGDLRTAVIDAGMQLLQSGDIESFSLREVARNVGVSATAIYRHFPDRGSLLAALAVAGYVQLGREQGEAAKAGGAEGFAASGRAYVRFAIANPSLFRLMFAATPAMAGPGHDAQPGSPEGVLEHGIAQLLGPDAPPHHRFVGMVRAWSLVHGLAMLILDRQIDPAMAEAMIDEVVGADSLNFS